MFLFGMKELLISWSG